MNIGLGIGTRYPKFNQLSLTLKAISAIRRNGGTLIGIPDNFAGAYIDSAGTQPVTAVGDVLGLLTDRSYGAGNLGAELVTNGSFDADANWIKGTGWAISGGVAAKTPGTASTIVQGSTLAAGKVYEVYYTVSGRTSGQCTFAFVGGTSVIDGLSSTNGLKRCTLTVLSGNNSFGVSADSTFNGAIDNISVREVLGNHATQPTTASKPTVTRVPKRLGPNLVVNGTFDSGTTGWSGAYGGTLSASGGELVVVRQGANGRAFTQIAATIGKSYQVSGSVKKTAGTTNADLAYGQNTFGGVVTVIGSTANSTLTYFSAVMTAAVPVFTVTVGGNGGASGDTFGADNIEVREVLEWTNAISFDGSNDFLQSGITTGNEGWICAGVTFGGAAGALETVAGSGAYSPTGKGVWLARVGSVGENTIWLATGNGTTRNIAAKTDAALRNTPRVVDGGWTATTCFVAVDGVESANTRSGDMTPPAESIQLGTASGLAFHNGPMSAIVYTPVLPSAADRALIRKWIGSLQGQTL